MLIIISSNPCFNGSMYKNGLEKLLIKTVKCFNPCFNGSMYKNINAIVAIGRIIKVSILVLMDLCIKTKKG